MQKRFWLAFFVATTMILVAGCGDDDTSADDDDDNNDNDNNDSQGDDDDDENATGPLMRPGEACLGCHSDGSGSEAAEHPFVLAGTVFTDKEGSDAVDGATVKIEDDDGNTIELTSNKAGNFYTEAEVNFPAKITITADDAEKGMPEAPKGDCNDCHNPDGNAKGYIYVN